MKKILLSTLIVFSMSSCCTIFTGTKKRIVIDSNISQADEVVIDGRKYKDVSFPMSVKVKRGFNESVVTGKAEGYEKSTIQVEKVFHTLAILNLCDIFGWAIDAATGAMMKPEYNDYELEFVKEKQ